MMMMMMQVPAMIRAASPVYVKLGLKRHGNVYPAGGHLEGGIVVRSNALSLALSLTRRVLLSCARTRSRAHSHGQPHAGAFACLPAVTASTLAAHAWTASGPPLPSPLDSRVRCAPSQLHRPLLVPPRARAQALSRERVRRARLVLDIIDRYYPDAKMSPAGSDDLGIPEL
jgi:hypothetical protein